MVRHLALAGLFAASLATSSVAEEFNVYGAIKDGMSLTDAMPVITSLYPELSSWKKNLFEPYDGGTTLLVQGKHAGRSIFFLFCSGVLAGAMAPIDAKVAAHIVSGAAAPASVFVNEGGVTLSYPELEVGLDYVNVGGLQSGVILIYPLELALRPEFEKRCTSLDN